jgi:hypothetical protein
VTAERGHAPHSHLVLDDHLFARDDVHAAEVALTTGALLGDAVLADLDTAEAGLVPGHDSAFIRKVAGQVFAFCDAELAVANFLILFEEDAVLAAKQPSAVLAETGGLFVAAKQASLYLTSPGCNS